MTKLAQFWINLKAFFLWGLASTLFVLLGLFLVVEGWNALKTGQVLIHPKGGVAYQASSDGPNSLSFYFHSWFCLAAGVFFAALPAVSGVWRIYACSSRVMHTQKSLSISRLKSGPNLPWWAVTLVLIAFALFLVHIARKWY